MFLYPGNFFLILTSSIIFLSLANPNTSAWGNSTEMISPELEEELRYLKAEEITTNISTFTSKELNEVPGIATVVTEEQIRRMGARNLLDVLKRVPGMAEKRANTGITQSLEVRGVGGTGSEKVLVMLDGHRLNDFFMGGIDWNDEHLFPLDNISRIEIIRGPGSALYGANAFVAVINLISKKGEDIKGVETRISVGSFDTYETTIIAGTRKGDFQISYHSFYQKTGGPRLHVDTDKASIGGTSVAPGDTKDEAEKIEIGMNMDYKGSYMNLRYVSTERKGGYLGLGPTLNDESIHRPSHFITDIGYNFAFMEDRLNIEWKGYYDHIVVNSDWELYSEGYLGVFTDGIIGQQRYKTRVFGTEIRANYRLFDGNELVIGTMYEDDEQYDVTSHTNYNPIYGTPLPYFQEVTSWANWNKDVKRNIFAVYLQDTWDVIDSIGITAGVRYDNYNDVGDTWNPRLGIVYRFLEGGYLKLLYGSAFRAPNTRELYTINNPVLTGNPDARPEKVKTYEIAAGYKFSPLTGFNINYFHNEFSDVLSSVLASQTGGTLQFRNSGDIRSNGVEMEFSTGLNRDITTYINYSYVFIEEGENFPLAFQSYARHKGNMGFNIRLLKHYTINPNIYFVSQKERKASDTRDPTPRYALVDLNLRIMDFWPDTEASLSVHNLFDKKYYDSSPVEQNVNPDFPRAGISVMGTVRVKF